MYCFAVIDTVVLLMTFYKIVFILRILLLPTRPVITWLVTILNKMNRFLYEMLCIREGVFEFCQKSYFLSTSQVDDIISFLTRE